VRDAGHVVVRAGERAVDPGDAALLAEAVAQGRNFVTKHHDTGTFFHRGLHARGGVLALDDLDVAVADTSLIPGGLAMHQARLDRSMFHRSGTAGVRESRGEATAWQAERNKKHAKADWQFTTAYARVKLKRLYPSI